MTQNISYEVRIYQYIKDGFMNDALCLEETEESFDTLEESLEYYNREIRFLDPNGHYYTWLIKQYWLESDDNTDLEEEEYILYLTNDIKYVEKPKLAIYNHKDFASTVTSCGYHPRAYSKQP